MKDVTKDLRAGEVDQNELATVISHVLHRAQFTSAIRIDFPTSVDPQLTLHYTKKGALSRIESSLSARELNKLRLEVETKLLGATESRISRAVLFANHPVDGIF